jgi:hypothetical protein
MKQIHFDRPIRISFGKAGKTRLVHTVWEAMKCLANDKWPNRAGPRWEMADHTLRGALHGFATVNEASQAFLDAAREAKILVEREPDRCDPHRHGLSPTRTSLHFAPSND